MAEEIRQGIYRIRVPLPNNPLRLLNSYLIRRDGEELLIDTGFRCEECEQALREGLREIGCDTGRLSVLATHLHSDHTGLVRQIAGPEGRIYMSDIDLPLMQVNLFGDGVPVMYRRYMEEGFPPPLIDEFQERNPSMKLALDGMDDRFCTIKDGDEITVGDYTLQAILTPGHTPGHTMFWMEEQRIMFTGDHILFDITPNITAWNYVEDALGDYMDSLRRVQHYPVELTLPGHRESGDYHQRIDSLLAHHEQRLGEVIAILRENPGSNAYEVAGRMKWKIRAESWASFPTVQKYFAMGECLAHLDFLLKRGQIVRKKDRRGVWYFCT